MALLKNLLKNFFKTSTSWDEYTLVKNIRNWQDSNTLPLRAALPLSFRLSSDFWNKILDIYRYTQKDGKEHAISIWSVYKQIIITEVSRGSETQVTTNDRVKVEFKAVKGRQQYVRYIHVNGKVRDKTTIPYEKMPKTQEEAEMRYLFNVHTHPPHVDELTNTKYYSDFSKTDIDTFLGSSALITGLLSDKLTMIFKTRHTPKVSGLDENQQPDTGYLGETLQMVQYEADLKTKKFIRKG